MSSTSAPLSPGSPPVRYHLGEATACYANALDALDATATDAGSLADVFAAARARDGVAPALTAGAGAVCSPDALRDVVALDALR